MKTELNFTISYLKSKPEKAIRRIFHCFWSNNLLDKRRTDSDGSTKYRRILFCFRKTKQWTKFDWYQNIFCKPSAKLWRLSSVWHSLVFGKSAENLSDVQIVDKIYLFLTFILSIKLVVLKGFTLKSHR